MKRFILLAALLSGCAQMVWTKTDLTEAQLAKDEYGCMRETGHTSDMNALEGIGTVFSTTGAGLQGGYSPQLARAQYMAGTKNLFNACMKAYRYKPERKAE